MCDAEPAKPIIWASAALTLPERTVKSSLPVCDRGAEAPHQRAVACEALVHPANRRQGPKSNAAGGV